ncbi:FUSC family protein [Leifsonia aquatica]|uniref:FUSC family protein n=1 Tax=Leifsonia aquatica TaxID=144185 RepID=UPI0004680F34|nr:FUSC family protein [Leifsonia aquatica]
MKHLRLGLAALITTAAAAAACATVWLAVAAFAGPAAAGSPAVLATVVALSLARRSVSGRGVPGQSVPGQSVPGQSVPGQSGPGQSVPGQSVPGRREFVRSAALLPVIGVAAAGVGWLLVVLPPVGALLYIGGMSVPIWLRRFGPSAARLGALVALPLTAVLVVPVVPAASGTPWWEAALLTAAAGVVAVLWVAVAREVAGLLRLGTAPGGAASAATAPAPGTSASPPRGREATRAPSRRLPASTRMAVQMAVALAAAFVVGGLVFPQHAMWVVLTAFIVNSGNRGRADVLHTSALRVAGAIGGTVLALGLAAAAPQASGFAAVVVVFVALFAGTWLRSYSYAFWALAVTVVLTVLQQLFGTTPAAGEAGLLLERVLAIVVGAGLGIGAAWFVLPVRSTDVLRRRLSDLLIALGAVLTAGPDDRAQRAASFRSALRRVEELAPAHRARRLLGGNRIQPIDCIDAASALGTALGPTLGTCLGAADQGHRSPEQREQLRDALRQARASLAAPADLERVHARLTALASLLRGGPVA